MRVLVTGGAGFLGSHLVDALLKRGDEVVVFDHRLRGKALSDAALARVRAMEGDIRDAVAVTGAAEGCRVIFHCAALVGIAAYSGQPEQTRDTEQAGLRHISAAAASNRAKVVYASSSAVYGRAGGAAPLEETTAAPESSYAMLKRDGELYLEAQHREHGLSSVALRIFNMYGPRQDERLAIPRFIHAALNGDPIEIYGNGGQTRDFVYVGDVAAAALACADTGTGCEIVNVCSGRETSVRGVAETVCRIARSDSKIASREMPDSRASFEVPRSFGSRAKLAKIAGVQQQTSLEDGLTLTVAAMRGRS